MKSNKNNKKLSKNRYLAAYFRKKKNFGYHPESADRFSENTKSVLCLRRFSPTSFEEYQFENAADLIKRLDETTTNPKSVCWIDMAGINPVALQTISNYFQIHNLLRSDILSYGQRAKEDDMGNQLFALLPMLSYNKDTETVEPDQLCIWIKEGFILSFHNNSQPYYFEQIKAKIKKEESPARNNTADYLMYLLLDAVVDHYFDVSDIISDQLDQIEEQVITNPDKSVLFSLSLLRHKVLLVKRAIVPVRELINNFCISENPLIAAANKKFFKDIYDHITLAVEYNDNYREMVFNLQDLYMNQVNTKLNEVMKILTIITALLAPFTVISGIYGMNFDRIPFSSMSFGFFLSIGLMLAVSAAMLLYFRKKGWFR